MKAEDILTNAAHHLRDRAIKYDSPAGERSMARTVEAFNALTDNHLTEEQGWLFMSVLKIVRSLQGDFNADNYEDEAAYAALRGECASKGEDHDCELTRLRKRIHELESHLEAIGAGGVTSGQKLRR